MSDIENKEVKNNTNEKKLVEEIIIDPSNKEDKEEEEEKIESELDLGEKLLKVEPVIAAIAILLMVLLANSQAFTAFIGTIIVIMGEGLRIYSKIYAGSNFSIDTEEFATAVINDGPYKYIRHPMFLANILVLFGMAIFSGSILMILLTPVWFFIQYALISKYEDSLLVLKNKDYEKYIEEVPAWICNYKNLKLDIPSFEESLIMIKSEFKLIIFIFVVLLLFCCR